MVEFNYFGNRLYRIDLFADYSASEAIERGLRARFGEPNASADETVQNAYGAQFPQAVTVWTRGQQHVATIAPALNLQRMVISYTDDALQRTVDSAAADANTPVM